MRRRSIFCLLALWMLTTASSCQTSFDGGGSSFSASGTAAGVTVAALVVVGGVYCLAHWDDCFPDEEALRARAEEQAKARAAFAAGLRRWRTGDPDGLRWICLSAHQGFANAQYLYGVHLVIPKMEDYKSPRPFCEEIKTRLEQGADWAMYNFYRAVYVYYTDSLVDVIMTKEKLIEFLDRPTKSLVAMREWEYNRLDENIKSKMHLIYKRQIGHRPMVLVSNQKE